jgi:AcrR family transcriptional regulator
MTAAEPVQARMFYRDAVSPTENTEPAGRPARRRLAPDDRRQALINSALKLFNTHLYDEVSVDDIAAEAGMSRPLVYH